MRLLLTSAGAVLMSGTGAFFLYVPPSWIGEVLLVVLGLTLMFVLGFPAGIRGMVPATAVVVATRAAF